MQDTHTDYSHRAAVIDADRLLAVPGSEPARRNVRIVVDGGAISAIEPGPGASGTLVMPAWANAHDHGRGLRRLAYGAVDGALEAWLPAASLLHPPVDPYLAVAAAFARMARAGITSVVHCHMPQQFDRLIEESEAVCRAARDVGLRLAFVVPMVDRNRLAYDGDQTVFSMLSAADREAWSERWARPLPTPDDQIEMVRAVAERCEGNGVQVQFGPFGIEWASDKLLERIAAESAATGRRIHMHCQETRMQREWVDSRYPAGFAAHLDDMGFLSSRLTLAHGVWLTPGECGLLAARGVTVSVNVSSNLRLRSGVAPVREFIRHQTRFALGMDALSIDDDDDALRELRLTYLLHAGVSFDESLTPARLFAAAAGNGARAVTGLDGFGTIAPGAPADLVVLDYAALAADLIEPDATGEMELVLARATVRHVREVISAGRIIVKGGKVLGIDEAATVEELLGQARAGAAQVRGLRPLVGRLQDAIRTYYRNGMHRRPQGNAGAAH